MADLRETPLAPSHRELGAKLVPFAGWAMPVQYEGVLDEHRRVRESVGLFDVGHMGTVFVRGAGVDDFLQALLTNDVTKAAVGRAQYTMLCNEAGGVVDDLIISHLDDDEWMIVPNASNAETVVSILRSAADDAVAVEVEDVSSVWGIIAIQGPRYAEVLADVLPGIDVGRFGVTRFETDAGLTGVLSGTGYTGSPGVEVVAPAETIVEVWDAALTVADRLGGGPVGLGARDTLRLEMGYPLHGQDITPEIGPLEAGLGWVVKLDKGEFRGAEALRAQKAAGVPRRQIGLLTPDRRPPRQHCAVLDASGAQVGEVTSGNFSPILGRGVGLALVDHGADPVAVDIRGRSVDIEVVKPPFIEIG